MTSAVKDPIAALALRTSEAWLTGNDSIDIKHHISPAFYEVSDLAMLLANNAHIETGVRENNLKMRLNAQDAKVVNDAINAFFKEVDKLATSGIEL